MALEKPATWRNWLVAGLLCSGATGPAAGLILSEVYLPGSGLSGFEITGVGSAGATLVRLDARPQQRLRIVDHWILPGRSDAEELTGPDRGLTVDLLIEGASEISLATSTRVTSVGVGELHLDRAASAWVLLEGPNLPGITRRLAEAGAEYALFPGSPIADWVSWAPGESTAEASEGLETLGADAAEALGITGLARPTAATGGDPTGANLLIRPRNEDGFVRDAFWAVGEGWRVGGEGLGMPGSPGRLNPRWSVLPEPTAALLLAGGLGLVGFRRRG